MRTAGHSKNVRHWDSIEYKLTYYKDFDFTHFQSIDLKYRTTKTKHSYNDIIIMADTETSKSINYPECLDNYIVAWSAAFRSFGHNLVTLYGHKPSEFIEMLKLLRQNLPGTDIYIYFHNLSYDWPFIRKWMIKEFGKPVKQLNTKSLFPLFITFENGIILKDSLSLSQCKLEKWASDLNVEHQKAVGMWDYERQRNQSDKFTSEELLYIENDVAAGVECIDATLKVLNKNISSIPYTNTGIVRQAARAAGGMKAHHDYVKISPKTFTEQLTQEEEFHGGYTHANRYILGQTYPAKCKDIASSYPFMVMTMQAPMEAFFDINDKVDIDYILKDNPHYAFMFRLKVFGLDLKDLRFPMPMLSLSKCRQTVNAICDNGRVLRADYVEFVTNEVDFELFVNQYKWDEMLFFDVKAARKDYIPSWYTDFIYGRFISKTQLKGIDAIRYMIEKGMLNAGAFGMIAQKPCKEIILEDYDTGEFYVDEDVDPEKEYIKHLNNPRSFLPYIWAVYCTSGAMKRLYELGECVDYEHGGIWLYSDTDSVYATLFDEKKIEAYNQRAKDAIKARGYDPVFFKGKYYYLGVAEDDGDYSEFRTWHSKCYAKRDRATGKLSITVAGVPKAGVNTLKDDINNFVPGLIFDGVTSGKLQHKHITLDDVYIDANGNEVGDSVDLTPCDYLVRSIHDVDFDFLTLEEIAVNFYDDTNVEG